VFGAQFSPLAIQAIVITLGQLDKLPEAQIDTQLGLLAFFNTLPFLTLGLFAGVWADRHRRRRIMILADFGRAAVLFIIPGAYFLTGFQGISVTMLYAVTLFAGILTVFFEIAYQAHIPNLVQKSQIVEANSKMETSRSVSQVAGPSAAGAIIAVLSAPLAVFGDVLGYLSSSVSLLSLRRPEEFSVQKSGRSTWHDIREGLKVVFGDRRLRAIAGSTGTSNLFSSAWGALIVIYLHNDLGLSYPEIGVAFGIGALGGVFGALTARRFISLVGVGRAIVLSIGAFSPGAILLFLATPGDALPLAAVAIFLVSIGVLWYNIPQVSYRQALVPKEVQGRMNATMRTIVWGTLPLGGLMGGFVGNAVGTHATIGIMTVLGSLAFLWVLFSPLRQVKDMPSD
jgi:MFS family permease